MNSSSKNIIIIGGGVSGLTTGILLQKLGFNSTIYTKEHILQSSPKKTPLFASLFPAASIIPHSVFGQNVLEAFGMSQFVFEQLEKHSQTGVNSHKHYELFEQENLLPDYFSFLKNPEEVFFDEPRKGVPFRSEFNRLYGWVFDCYFTDWPIYVDYLLKAYHESGGKIIMKHVHPSDIPLLPSQVVVNCSGYGSTQLFNDNKRLLYQGHLIDVAHVPNLVNDHNQIVSYNYQPNVEPYISENGNLLDVYAYPRKNGIILGGSRFIGTLTNENEWQGEHIPQTSLTIDGLALPAQIMDLNTELIKNAFGISLYDYKSMTTKMGYRYVRDDVAGLRLEYEHLDDSIVIHNYGHGGAGVSLSWGCSLYVLNTIQQQLGQEQITIEEIPKLIV